MFNFCSGAEIKLSDLPLSTEGTPISRYNEDYFCEVLCGYLTNGKVDVVFRVQGDESLGPLQSAISSTLYLCHIPTQTATILGVESSNFVENTDTLQRGTLRYALPKDRKFSQGTYSLAFEFGIGGYNACTVPTLRYNPFLCMHALSLSCIHHYHWNLESRASSLGGLLWEVWAHIAEFCDVPDALVMSR
eukprot:PhF_6_TR30404/c0_g1_i6/m.44588